MENSRRYTSFTGTFLAEVVKRIGTVPQWFRDSDEEHLKFDLLLIEVYYKPKNEQSFRVYLTSSLEEHHPDTGLCLLTNLAPSKRSQPSET